MGRIVIQELALFGLPVLLYLLYFLWKRRQARLAGNKVPGWEEGQWFWVVVVGLVLAIAGVVVTDLVLVGRDPNAIYTPPKR